MKIRPIKLKRHVKMLIVVNYFQKKFHTFIMHSFYDTDSQIKRTFLNRVSAPESRLYSYKNGEIWYVDLTGFKSDHNAFLSKINEEDTCRPKSTLRALINLTDTKIKFKLVKQLIYNLNHSQHDFIKLAFIGFTTKEKLFIDLIQLTRAGMNFPFKFFKEADLGKDWLITEN